jgi:hypothetical protein
MHYSMRNTLQLRSSMSRTFGRPAERSQGTSFSNSADAKIDEMQ